MKQTSWEFGFFPSSVDVIMIVSNKKVFISHLIWKKILSVYP